MNPEISVIIPVYNVEKYIIPCLNSVKNQSFNDFEVIIIDDGSTDNSHDIIEKYIKYENLDNFRLIYKKNGGISTTRNCGLDNATGKWVFFLDSDDWLECDALSTLHELSLKFESDLVIGGYQAVDDITGEKEIWCDYPNEFGKIPEDFCGLHSFGFCWARLFKKEIIDLHNIRFDVRIPYAEDNAWHFDYNRHISSYSCTNKVIYNYRINREGSVTNKLVTPQMKYFIWEHLEKFIQSFEEDEILKAIRTNTGFNRVFWRVTSTAIVNDILNKNYSQAKAKRKMKITQEAASTFNARSTKDRFFINIFKKSFLVLCVFVNIYYKNFEKLRTSKFINKVSKMK